MKFGTRFAIPLRATGIERQDDGVFCVRFDDGQSVCARAVVVATGVEYRRLPLPRLEEFEGNGVYYAATELEARWCRGTEAVIVGGGNSAGQAAMYLSRNAEHVHVVVRVDVLGVLALFHFVLNGFASERRFSGSGSRYLELRRNCSACLHKRVFHCHN